MAFPMESTIQAMTGDMRGKLHAYMGSLEHRFGDPEVYALQREAAAMEHAARRLAFGGPPARPCHTDVVPYRH